MHAILHLCNLSTRTWSTILLTSMLLVYCFLPVNWVKYKTYFHHKRVFGCSLFWPNNLGLFGTPFKRVRPKKKHNWKNRKRNTEKKRHRGRSTWSRLVPRSDLFHNRFNLSQVCLVVAAFLFLTRCLASFQPIIPEPPGPSLPCTIPSFDRSTTAPSCPAPF